MYIELKTRTSSYTSLHVKMTPKDRRYPIILQNEYKNKVIICYTLFIDFLSHNEYLFLKNQCHIMLFFNDLPLVYPTFKSFVMMILKYIEVNSVFINRVMFSSLLI